MSETWYSKNRERVIRENKEYRLSNPHRYLYSQTKRSATERGLDFDLSVDDIVIPEKCPYLGIELKLEFATGRRNWSNPSVDRIDNSKGYVKGNVQVISGMANKMKANATIEELLTFAKGVLKHHEQTT